MKTWGPWEIIRRQVTIGGCVKDKAEKPIAEATVSITAFPKEVEQKFTVAATAARITRPETDEMPDRMFSRPDGIYFFLDLPDGEYTLKVTSPGTEGEETKKARVSRDKDGNVKKARADFKLHP